MKRVWGHVLAGVSVLGIGAVSVAAISACVHDDSTLFVAEVLAPQLVTPGMECTFTADPSQLHITSGVLDTGIVGAYEAEFLVGNQIVPQGNPTQPDTETSFVKVEGAVVRILDTNGKQLTSFTEPTAITIPPSSGTTPGYSPIGLTIIDAPTVQSLGILPGATKTLISYTHFFGHTLGGDSVESDEFGFPVDVCNSCLVTFSSMDINPQFKSPNCAGAATAMMSSMTVPCRIGQDFTVDCANCFTAACRPNEGVSSGIPTDAGSD